MLHSRSVSHCDEHLSDATVNHTRLVHFLTANRHDTINFNHFVDVQKIKNQKINLNKPVKMHLKKKTQKAHIIECKIYKKNLKNMN